MNEYRYPAGRYQARVREETDQEQADTALEKRATPELLNWVAAVQQDSWREAAKPALLYSACADGEGARPEDFAFFFHSAANTGASAVTEDEAAARRARKAMKVMLLQAMLKTLNEQREAVTQPQS